MTALLLFAALAIDVTSALSAERFYTTTADAAALAGAQDLQKELTRIVTLADQRRAREHAMQVLRDQLGANDDPLACDLNYDVDDCPVPGTDYLASITTPSLSCDLCDKKRAIQVTIKNPLYRLTFAQLVGQSTWSIESTAVAGISHAGQYAVLALKPPEQSDQETIMLAGTNTILTIGRGDIGTNTNADTAGGEARYDLTDGYDLDYFDDSFVVDEEMMWWNGTIETPKGTHITSLILDPNYYDGVPVWELADTFGDQAEGALDECPDDSSFPKEDWAWLLNEESTEVNPGSDQDLDVAVTCYKPGIYNDSPHDFVVAGGDVAYLTPGAYRFEVGVDIQNGGWLVGGLVSGEPGVVIEVPQDQVLAGQSQNNVILNVGGTSCSTEIPDSLKRDLYPDYLAGFDDCRAAPAKDSLGNSVKTPDPENLPITIYVPPDSMCFSGTTPLLCQDNQNSTINLAGGATFAVAGVVYAPSDSVSVSGGTAQDGYVGQIIAWNIKYSGSSKLVQDYPHKDQLGVMRLDSACTGTEKTCDHPS